MSRTYSSFLLICVVTQALTDIPEGLCQGEIRYYKCTSLQYSKVAKVKLTYTCCDGYYSRNGRCEKEAVNATPGTTCNTCLCNDTCTNDTTSVTGNLSVPIEANQDEDSKCNNNDYNDSSSTITTVSIDIFATPEEGNHTEDESKEMSVIITVLLVALVVVMVTVIICWKVLHHCKQKNNSRSGKMEMQTIRNIAEDQNVAHGIGGQLTK